MPCITLPIDLSVGPVFPVRLRAEHGGRDLRTRAMLSTSSADSLISPDLAKKLGSIPVGITDLALPHRVITNVPFHVLTLKITTGLLGNKSVNYKIKRVVLLESDRDKGVGVILGMDFIALGMLTITASSATFCV